MDERRGETTRAASRSLNAKAHAHLKRRIIRCELAPGQRVTEAQLVADLDIGKTPVREALAKLHQEGFVEVLPRHGYRITPITLGAVQELFGLRLVVEPASIRLAAGHVAAAQRRRLDELCQAGYIGGDRASVEAFVRAHHELHALVAQIAGNRRLAELVAQLLLESERLFHLGLLRQDCSAPTAWEHRGLVEVLAASDAARAEQIAREQIVAERGMVMAAVLMSPAVLAAPVTAPQPFHAPAEGQEGA